LKEKYYTIQKIGINNINNYIAMDSENWNKECKITLYNVYTKISHYISDKTITSTCSKKKNNNINIIKQKLELR